MSETLSGVYEAGARVTTRVTNHLRLHRTEGLPQTGHRNFRIKTGIIPGKSEYMVTLSLNNKFKFY